jgi:hypothetical protein
MIHLLILGQRRVRLSTETGSHSLPVGITSPRRSSMAVPIEPDQFVGFRQPWSTVGWIDPRTGVITAAWFENEDLDDGPYFVSAQLSSYSNSKFSPVPGDPCGGKGINRVDAIRSGIGEALERYSAGRLACISHTIFA